MKNQIEKQIELKAPISKVWNALTDYKQFSEWFGVALESPFKMGETTEGQITIEGYEFIRFTANVQKMEAEQLFSYTWHPASLEKNHDYSNETPTLVEFKLTESTNGTLLTVIETGFNKLPENRREESFRRNSDGWAMQLESIEEYLTSKQPV
jgi:uncharacterized protein YndB with AHSA1/START domain